MRALTLLFGTLLSVLAYAQDSSPTRYEVGTHYEEIDTPVRTADPDKIEVTEIFWYGCGHCFTFAPIMLEWEAQAPDDVVVQHSPAIWRDVMATHARIYYAAKALNKLEEIHMAAFRAMHQDGKRLANESQIAELFTRHGVAEEDFKKVFNSFGVKSQVQQADARQRGYGVTGTPTLVVDGRYRISGRNLNGQREMLKVAEYLIDQIRQEK